MPNENSKSQNPSDKPTRSLLAPENFDVIFSEEEIRQRVRELGAQISRDYEGRVPLLVSMLKGSAFFLSDLSRAITIPHHFDFLSIKNERPDGDEGGIIRIERDLGFDIEGRDVLVIEEILRSGLTTNYMLQILEERNPRSLKICALLANPDRMLLNLPLEYLAFEIDERRCVGYGMDIKEAGRQLPFIAQYHLGMFKSMGISYDPRPRD